MKRNLYIITLEKIEQRYTKQWYTYWKQEFSKYFKVKYIDGPDMNDDIINGKFLDINKTNLWKAVQIEKLSKLFINGKIKNGDRFIFMDAWHYGITALKYMSQLNNIKIKIYGYWHAGSYDSWDFISQSGLSKWASCNELGWLNALDGNFVATKYHKKLICNYFENNIQKSKIHVVGFPMDWESEIKKEIGNEKENKFIIPTIVFPHRLDKEKQPHIFDKLSQRIYNADFVKTLLKTKTKKEYYNLLSKSHIMFSSSLQETFGIGTVESIMLNVIPIVPDRLSYVELYDKIFRYKNLLDAINKIRYLIKNPNDKMYMLALMKNKEKIISDSLDSINKMSKIMIRR